MHRDIVYAIARTVVRETDYFAVPHEGVTEDTWHVALYDHHGRLLGNLTEQDIKKAIVLRDAGIILDDLLDHTMSATPQGGREKGITVHFQEPVPVQGNYEQHAQGGIGITPIPKTENPYEVDPNIKGVREGKHFPPKPNPFTSDDDLAGKAHR